MTAECTVRESRRDLSEDERLAVLWHRYKTDGARVARDELALHYRPLVKSVADRVAVSVPRYVDRADLASFGLFGLFDAIDKFDPGRGFRFETYAISRIKGAILDELRSIDWVPRKLRAHARAVERAESELQNRLLRAPSDEELIAELGVSRDALDRTKALINASRAQAFEDAVDVMYDVAGSVASMGNGSDPYQDFDSRDSLTRAMKCLSWREHTVLTSYYIDSMTLAEIGATLGVTESRVCQIHRKAIVRLRAQLEREEAPLAVR